MQSPPVKGTPGRFTPGRSRLGPPQRASENGNGHRVRVVTRVRPFLAAEVSTAGSQSHNCTSITKGTEEDCVIISTENASSHIGQGCFPRKPAIKLRISWLVRAEVCRCEEYKLDACYGEATDNAEVFANEVQPILQCLLEGGNATVFAYGATGSGKTHTMQGTEKDPGLMFRAVSSLFSAASSQGCSVAISYYEVYMDRCYDLLEMKNEVPVLEDHNGNIQFRGLAKVEIKNIDEFQSVLAEGCARRRVGSTVLNDVSSRSHGVLAVTVTSTDMTTGGRKEAKLNLIDLAGNEDNRKTGNDGVRLSESNHINQSLFALSNVINALNANDARVPYRDSKLTRILRDSLGGTSRSVMVACLNPGSYLEAARTLSLAARSRQVVNHTDGRHVDELSKLDMVAKLQAWKEARTKTPVKPLAVHCSPSPLKPYLMKSPPHVRSPKTPASNKNLLERMSNKSRVKNSPKANLPLAVPSKKIDLVSPTKDQAVNTTNTEVSDERGSETVKPQGAFSEALYNNCTNPLFQYGDAPSDIYGDDADKENDFLHLIGSPYTPLSHELKPRAVGASPPLSMKLKSIARALNPPCPVDTNGDTSEETPVSRKSPTDLTPVVDSSVCALNFDDAQTPYEKFNRSTAKIREMLEQQYLDVLNTAPREQLLMLKGFGRRRTDAILELRETSREPMKDIKDLERIGVSAKQAYAIFNSNVIRQISFAP